MEQWLEMGAGARGKILFVELWITFLSLSHGYAEKGEGEREGERG